MDACLEALYEGEGRSGLGPSNPNINRWLGDIRTYFPTPVVQLLQRDALERLGLQQMLLEPELLESIEPDVHLVGTLLSLSKMLPERSRETARMVVKQVVEALQQKLHFPLQQAVQGSMRQKQRTRRPRRHSDIDWPRTIRANLKHYQEEYGTIIPEQLHGYQRRHRQLQEVFLLIDQSGSMASSVVYAGVMAAILASLSSLRTHVIAFDTSVVDLTEYVDDPVSLLFATQLGGGTDITRALRYTRPLLVRPRESILILISDLFEGNSPELLLHQVVQLKESGVHIIPLLALNDEGAPAYDREIAQQLANLGLPAFACTPGEFPDLMAAAINRQPLQTWLTNRA